MPALLAGTTIEANDMSLAFPASPSTGQIYQGWRFNGSAWDPNYAANFVTSFNGRSGAVALQAGDATSGNRVLLQSQAVASSVASVSMFYNFNNAFDLYELDIYDLTVGAGSPVYLALQASYDGATFPAESTWFFASMFTYHSSSSVASVNAANQSFLMLGVSPLASSTATRPIYLVKFAKPWTTDRSHYFLSDCVGHGSFGVGPLVTGGVNVNTAAIRGFKFFDSGGVPITGGTFKLYGVVP
jgi:hypothetical protein